MRATNDDLVDLICNLRAARGATQSDIGKESGIGQSRYCQIEGGKIAISFGLLHRILDVYNLELLISVQRKPKGDNDGK